MDSQEELNIRETIVKWLGKSTHGDGIDHYSHEEFLKILETMQAKEEEHESNGKKYGSSREAAIHRYCIINILEPLIGRMKYGKRN